MSPEVTQNDSDKAMIERTKREQALLGELRVLFSATRAHISAVKRSTGISAALLWALHEIIHEDGISMGDLATRLRVHPTTASNLCSRLRKRGLVLSTPWHQDRRILRLSATDKGRQLHAESPEPRRGVLPAVVTALSDAKLERAIRVLAGLRAEVTKLGYAAEPDKPVGRR